MILSPTSVIIKIPYRYITLSPTSLSPISLNVNRWQWCWWLYDGDWFQMLVAELLCWRLLTLCWWFSQCIISVTNIMNRSPTSQTCHQYIWSPTTVSTNIDETMSTALRCHKHYGSPRFEVQILSSKLSFWVIISQFKKMNH